MTDPDARKEIFVFKGQAVTNYFRVSKGFPGDSVGKESACNAGDPGSIPDGVGGERRFPGGGNGNPFQYSCLGNPMGRGA